MKYQGYGPNFHRLQVYSDTFEDLIEDSPTFKYILGTVKVIIGHHNNHSVIMAISMYNISIDSLFIQTPLLLHCDSLCLVHRKNTMTIFRHYWISSRLVTSCCMSRWNSSVLEALPMPTHWPRSSSTWRDSKTRPSQHSMTINGDHMMCYL